MTETELAQNVVTWLEDHKWTVYKEVPLHREGGIRADIFATMGNITWAIETKTTFGLQVMAQAWEWTRHAHYVSIAVPQRKSNLSTYRLESDILNKYGIGLLYLQNFGSKEESEFQIKEEYRPKLNRNIIKPKLHERYKTYSQAGNSNCDYFSAFKETKENIINFVSKNGPIQYQALIARVGHHYRNVATAKSCIRQYIDKRIIPELETYSENNKLMVRLTPTNTIMDHPLKPLEAQKTPAPVPPIINPDFHDLIQVIEQYKQEAHI